MNVFFLDLFFLKLTLFFLCIYLGSSKIHSIRNLNFVTMNLQYLRKKI